MVRHGSLASFAEVLREAFGVGPADRVLQFASISFDTSAEEIYPCLTAGGTLVLRDEEMVPRSPLRAPPAGHPRQITLLDLPTAYWHGLVAEMEQGLGWPATLRLVIVGGERAQRERLAAWRARSAPDAAGQHLRPDRNEHRRHDGAT